MPLIYREYRRTGKITGGLKGGGYVRHCFTMKPDDQKVKAFTWICDCTRLGLISVVQVPQEPYS